MKLAGTIKQVGFRYFTSDANEEIINNKNQTVTFVDEEESRKLLFLIAPNFFFALIRNLNIAFIF